MRLLSFIIVVMTAFISFANNCADSVNVRFHVGQRYYDPTLGDNREVMDAFITKVREAAAEGDIERIVVYGYASPEGKPQANERLARNRCATIAAYISVHAGISPDLIEERPGGIGWAELRRLVAANPNVPHQAKVLDILDNTPVLVFDQQGRVVDSRKKQLMDLAGGRPWNWMMVNIYPEVRNAVAISLCRRDECAEPTDLNVQLPDNQTEDGITIDLDSIQAAADSIAAECQAIADSLATAQALADLLTSFVIEPYAPRYALALKTNLLFYPLLMPNAELEWLINDNWSVAVEGNIAWWGSYKRDKSYRVCLLDAEARRWIMPRAPWSGFYVGAVAGGGWYDIASGNPGHYGELAMGGLTLGYSWGIGRRLALEAEIGAGYAFIHDREYIDIDGHHVYQRTRNINYFGPIKAKFSIAWRFFDVNKAKRAKTAK